MCKAKTKPAFPWRLLSCSIWLLLFTVPAFSQTGRQEITVIWDTVNRRQATVNQQFTFNRPFRAGDTLWFYDYLHAYASVHSDLGKSIAGHYKLEFHFSSAKDRGDTYLQDNPRYKWFRNKDFVGIIPAYSGTSLHLTYTVRLPHRKFTGLGYDRHGMHLYEFFLQPVVYRNGKPLFYTNKNLDDRPHLPFTTRIKIYPASLYPYWQSNGKIHFSGDTLLITHSHNRVEIMASNEAFDIFEKDGIRIVMEKGIPAPDDFQKALAIDEILTYLRNQDIPLASKIFITRRDWRDNPVYGLSILPVLNPFPKDFKFKINLLKQILYKSGKERFWDARRDHSIFTGLWQYYIKKYVTLHYPEMRLTGKPVKIFLLRSYYVFQVPYTEKYKLSYLYMARLNRDQALRLPADSLTLFNRHVTNPYKAALGWEFIEQYAGPSVSSGVIKRWFDASYRQYTGTEQVKAWLNEISRRDLSFLFKDYYRTARKIDFRNRKKTGGLYIKNLNHYPIPPTMETAGQIKDTFYLPVIFKDTLLPSPAKLRYFTVNASHPLPEINEKDNLAPRLRRPFKLRFWQDLEDPHSIQWFLNPDFDYNYYDGVILGMSLNNKTFFDKKWTWEIIPDYGLKSRYLSGYASFKYKKHFVRPYLHGWSFGGYFSSYHYAPEKIYRSYSLYTTLSHKNRKEKFFRENDLGLEWLSLYKQTDTLDETSSYRLLILSNTYKRRGLLKNLEWKTSLEWHPLFVKAQTDFRFRMFIDKFRQLEWRVFAGWMPRNRTSTDYFSFALSRPTDYLFKYNYYGRSETSGIFYQQYVYAEGAFKVFVDDQYANRWMLTNNVYIGIWKRFNLFADAGWLQSYGGPVRFHYDAGLRYYLVPDYFEVYFPFLYDGRFIPIDRDYWSKIRIMFVFDLPGLAKMFTRAWY